VVRYPSAYVNKKLGYRAGYPFDPFVVNRLRKSGMDIIHTHSPFISLILARLIRYSNNIPVVFTYHTKFDIEFKRVVAFNPVRSASVRFLLSNINACDEVWVVSQGAGENLRGLGYTGDYIVMENGTDFPRGKVDQDEIDKLRKHHHLNESTPIFLFVGRMMWYKGIRIIIDGLRIAKQKGYSFKMIFVGDGYDRRAIEEYAISQDLEEDCIFTGAIHDRQMLRAYFSLANLFLFPSTFDTNGIAVTEASACACPSVLIEGSCAAERIKHNETGILIKENAQELAGAVMFACDNVSFLKQIGNAALGKNLSFMGRCSSEGF
jgi:1,2-diacylglycerol 3-alpha-glucosyltransferase